MRNQNEREAAAHSAASDKDLADFMINRVLKSLEGGEITADKARGVLNYNYRLFLGVH